MAPSSTSPLAVAAPALPAASPVSAGIGLGALAFALFTVMDTMIKWLSAAYPVHELVFTNALFALLPVAAVSLRRGGIARLRTRKLTLHVARGCCGMGGAFFGFYAYSQLPLADAYSIIFATPLLITALSVPILGEQVGWRRWSAAAVGFAGVLIMLDPWGMEIHAMSLIVLGATFCYALSGVMLRLLSRHDSDVVALFWLSLATSAASLVGAVPAWVWPTPIDWVWLIVMGLLGGVAQILSTRAWRLAPTAVLAPFDYTSIVLAVLFGYLWFKEDPSWTVWYGLPLVIGSGLYVLHRERVRAQERAMAALP